MCAFAHDSARDRRSDVGPSIPGIPSDLVSEAAPSKSASLHSSPTQLAHRSGETPVCAGSAFALRNLKDVQQFLRQYTLDAIAADLAADSFKGKQPMVGFGRLGLLSA
jgi:hypothetical protein